MLPRQHLSCPCHPHQRLRLRVETRYSPQGFLTTVETRRSWITCCLTWVRARVRGRTGSTGQSTTPSPTDTFQPFSSTAGAGPLLFESQAWAMTRIRITLGRTLPPGSSSLELQTLVRRQAGLIAGGVEWGDEVVE